ncbi:MAG: hypothetical protein IPP70_09110 [Elusimicrobia bacterium]|nr:hypothetical protein [Elusimicrobiota bacterium]
MENLLAKRTPVSVHPNELDYLDKAARAAVLDVPRDHVKRSNAGTVLTLGAKSPFCTRRATAGIAMFLGERPIDRRGHPVPGHLRALRPARLEPQDLFESLNGVIGKLPDETILYRGTTTPAGASAAPWGKKKHNRFFGAPAR